MIIESIAMIEVEKMSGKIESGGGNYITSKRGICTEDKGMSERSRKRGMICETGGKHRVDFCFCFLLRLV